MKKIFLSILVLVFYVQVFSQDSQDIKKKIIQENFKPILELSFSGLIGDSLNNNRWPMYKNGLEGLDDFLKENIKYPEQAFSDGIEGTVVFDYLITNKGNIKDIRIIESPNQLLSNEIIRVMKLSGPWIPGIKDNSYKSMRMSKSYEFKK